MDRIKFVAAEKRRAEEEAKKKAEAEALRQRHISERANETKQILSTLGGPGLPVQVKEPDEKVKTFQYTAPVQPANPYSLTVSVIGAPNAGKSTLINRLVGSKISAVSTKQHTTRSNVLGVATLGDTQLCFVDTPGIISALSGKQFGRKLGKQAWESTSEADVTLLLVDCVKTLTGDQNLSYIMQRLEDYKQEENSKPVALVLNKVDRLASIEERRLVNPRERFQHHYPNSPQIFNRIFEISSLQGYGISELEDWLVAESKPREWQFDSQTKSDRSELEVVEEFIREQLYQRLNKEVPYNCRLENIGWTVLNNGTLRIDERVIVKKQAHVRMILGKKGRGIYSITEIVQQDMEEYFGRPILLYLYPKWDKSGSIIKDDEEDL